MWETLGSSSLIHYEGPSLPFFTHIFLLNMQISIAPSNPEYFFDSEGQILFDINTGEVVASFVGEKRGFFYDEDAMILFDEESGEILFSPPLD